MQDFLLETTGVVVYRTHYDPSIIMVVLLYFDIMKSVNVNPGLSFSEWCSLACSRLLAKNQGSFFLHIYDVLTYFDFVPSLN